MRSELISHGKWLEFSGFCFSFFVIRRSVTLVSNSRWAIKHCDFGQFLLCVMMIFESFYFLLSTLAPHLTQGSPKKLTLIDTLDAHFRLTSSKLNWMLWPKKRISHRLLVGGRRIDDRCGKTEIRTILILDFGVKFLFEMMVQHRLKAFLMKWTIFCSVSPLHSFNHSTFIPNGRCIAVDR